MGTKTTSNLVNKPIASLINGISQQPAALRLDSQAELQSNCYASLVEGLQKRPPARKVGKLNADTDEDSFVHYINRDTTEQYVLIIKDGSLNVYDLSDASSNTITYTASATYLDCTGAPRDVFSVVTIADYTFIVNKEKTVTMAGGVTGGTAAGTVQDFASLPGSPTTNDVYEVAGDVNNAFDNYYVKWDGSTWRESPKVGIANTITDTTMPHTLARTGASTFTFDVVAWGTRDVGDLTSSPDPSFIGKNINDIFFHRNRLGFLAGDNIILSTSPSSDFDFFRESATVLIDSDPIDIAASHTKVSTLYHAVPFDQSLLLFSEQTQFILSGSNILTPSSATIDVTTEFEASVAAKPVGAGPNVYFIVPKGEFSGVREYFVEDEVTTNDAADITAHAPTYIAGNVFELEASSNEDVLIALSTNERNKLWLYKYFWQGDEKVQSSWSTWEFGANDVLMGTGMIQTDLYVVSKRTDGTYLEVIKLQENLTDGNNGYQCLLDRREELTGSYSSGTGLTTWTVACPHINELEVILGDSFTNSIGKKLNVSYPSTTTVTAQGDYSSGTCFVGKPYSKTYTFSEFYLRDANKNALRNGRLMMKDMQLHYIDSGYFKVTVTPLYRNPYTYEFTGKVLGAGGFLLGSLQVVDGEFTVPLRADSRELTITLTNDSHLPSIIQSAEWNALYHGNVPRT
jgi:hypothetical protein